MKNVFLLVVFLSFVSSNISFAEDDVELGNSIITVEREITLSAEKCIENLKPVGNRSDAFVCRIESVTKKGNFEYFPNNLVSKTMSALFPSMTSQLDPINLEYTSGYNKGIGMGYDGRIGLNLITNGYEVGASMNFKNLSLEEAADWIKEIFDAKQYNNKKVTLIVQYPTTQ